jgi:hypothetical protein
LSLPRSENKVEEGEAGEVEEENGGEEQREEEEEKDGAEAT